MGNPRGGQIFSHGESPCRPANSGFQYRPRFLTPALLISAAILLGCIACLIFAMQRRRNSLDTAKPSAID